MPPKKKKDAKKKKKEEDAPAPAPVAEEETGVSTEELQTKIVELEKEKSREEESRNYMQLERDKISAFWEITKKELDDKKAEMRNKDREMEEMEERHQVEIKVYKQKVKHLLYEHQHKITTLKADGEMALKLKHDESAKEATSLQQDKRSLKLEIKESELAHEDVVRQLKLEHAKEITKLREGFEINAKELAQKYEKKMKLLRDDLEIRRKQEVHEVEERKNTHINELMKHHEKAFAEIKGYYQDVTHNNLDLIKTLKEEVAEMKKKESANEKLMYEIAQENKRLSEPLVKALKENETLRTSLQHYEKDKISLSQTKARLVDTEKQLKNLEWDYEVLVQKSAQTTAERDELYKRFESSIYDVQQKSGLKNLMLERKIEAMSDALEKKEAQLGEVLQASNLDPQAMESISRKLDEVLESKNALIRSLQYDVAKIAKRHNDVISVYEGKLSEYGVPVQELGFKPLATSTTTGPAGLVVS